MILVEYLDLYEASSFDENSNKTLGMRGNWKHKTE